MFDDLTERLSGVFDRLGGRGVLSDKDIDEALREVRVALLEADVALPVVKDFISKAKELASGEFAEVKIRDFPLQRQFNFIQRKGTENNAPYRDFLLFTKRYYAAKA